MSGMADAALAAETWQIMVAGIDNADDLARELRRLRRRFARQRAEPEPTYRELATATGWSHAAIGLYFTGKILPPTDRFDELVRLLGATSAELRALATARDRVEERRRQPRPPAGAAASTVAVSPHELPTDVYGFSGRVPELEVLDALRRDGGDAATVSIVVLAGTAGVGKTALAVHWAHRVAHLFPDGQLFVDLHGHGPHRPLPADVALAALLRSLGLPAAQVPADVAERAARFRTLMAGRRMLVLLDNAHSVDQVRRLLPGTGGSLVLVTSRDDLAGLVARDGARRMVLDVLPERDAVGLLRRLVGDRVDADPKAALDLAHRCARLPLALRVAAELAASRPDATMADLLADLRDGCPLSSLAAGGDPSTAVRAVLSWSYRNLSPAGARAFTVLARHPDRLIDEHALTALTGEGPSAARQMLQELARGHLLRKTGREGYAIHELLRAYAAELAGPQQSAELAPDGNGHRR